MIELRHLRTVLALAETGNLSKAATSSASDSLAYMREFIATTRRICERELKQIRLLPEVHVYRRSNSIARIRWHNGIRVGGRKDGVVFSASPADSMALRS